LTVDWRPWLPAGIAQRPEVRAELARVVDGWASAWFATACLSAADFGRPQDGGVGQPLALAVGPGELLHLAALAADLTDAPEALTGADRTLLRGLGEAMVADLHRRIEDRLAIGAPAPVGGESLEIRIGPRGARPTLIIAIAEAALVGLAKGLMSTPPAPRASLTGIAQALTETSLTIEAILGEANLTFGDLRGLAVGDVLVLDTPLEGLLALSLSGGDRAFATARLNPSDDHLTLTVSR
jgi:flagellar motor switch/type III secretory pathway protein FliN